MFSCLHIHTLQTVWESKSETAVVRGERTAPCTLTGSFSHLFTAYVGVVCMLLQRRISFGRLWCFCWLHQERSVIPERTSLAFKSGPACFHSSTTRLVCRKKCERLSKCVLFSSSVQPEDVTLNLDIINKKSYKTTREVFTHRRPPMTEIIKHIPDQEDKQQRYKRPSSSSVIWRIDTFT